MVERGEGGRKVAAVVVDGEVVRRNGDRIVRADGVEAVGLLGVGGNGRY